MDKRIRLRQPNTYEQSLHFSTSIARLATNGSVHDLLTEVGADRVTVNPDHASLRFRPPLSDDVLRTLGDRLLQLAEPLDSGAGNFLHFIDARQEPEQYWQTA